MSKHTPGPWGWEFFTNHSGDIQQYPVALSGPGPLSDVLLSTLDREGHVFIRVNYADRVLIAAAPDLLAACEEAWLFLDHLNMGGTLVAGKLHAASTQAKGGKT